MALSNAQIDQTWVQLVRQDAAAAGFTKADLKAAVSAVDSWATTNASSYNTALPDPFKSNATAAQKALLLAYVALRRAGI